MKTTTKYPVLFIGLIICTLLFLGCAETTKDVTVAEEKEIPMLELASQDYADLAQETLDVMETFNLDAWTDYFSDDVIWYWPDGNSETRHTIKGKDELISFWKDWKETTGGEFTFTNNTFLPIKINKPSNYYKLVGTGVISYTDMKISIDDKSTSVRQNIVFMFNDDKKINHVLLYYDRTGIIDLTNVVFGDKD